MFTPIIVSVQTRFDFISNESGNILIQTLITYNNILQDWYWFGGKWIRKGGTLLINIHSNYLRYERNYQCSSFYYL